MRVCLRMSACGFCQAPGDPKSSLVISETCQLALGGGDDAGQSCGDCTVEREEDQKPLLDTSSRIGLGMPLSACKPKESVIPVSLRETLRVAPCGRVFFEVYIQLF